MNGSGVAEGFSPVEMLRRMIAVPSPSRSEEAVSALIDEELRSRGVPTVLHGLNVTALAAPFDASKPVVMLNSHMDTVRPAKAYTRDPYEPSLEDNGARLYGLGSNDAGASVVSLMAAFLRLRPGAASLPYNLLLAITAQEEVGGEGGMRLLLPALKERGLTPDMVLVGEPTGMDAAVAERGLVVLDCVTRGLTGHAARNEGINAIYRAMADVNAILNYRFPRISEVLGPVKVSVTQIEAGRQHNVVPEECRWVVDVRTTDAYSNARTAELLQQAMSPYTVATPRSTRVQASVIPLEHPLVKAAIALGRSTFVSPTTSDMSLLHGIPSLKMGPGQSARSHSADEYVLTAEIHEAVDLYERLLLTLLTPA